MKNSCGISILFIGVLLAAALIQTDAQVRRGNLNDGMKIPVANNSDQPPIFSAVKNTGDEGGRFVFHRK